MLHPVFASERTDIAFVMDALACAPFRVTGLEVERTRALLARRVAVEAAPETPGDRERGRLRREP
jgi:hypothetical protein